MQNVDQVFRKHYKVEEVFCGSGLWVLNKPAGVLSHPNPPAREARNAILQTRYDFGDEAYCADADGARRRVYLVHRLDQDTSGLILLATDPELAAQLKEMFYNREISKEYWALVRGVPRPAEGTWVDGLEKRRRDGRLTVEGRPEPTAERRDRLPAHEDVSGSGDVSRRPLPRDRPHPPAEGSKCLPEAADRGRRPLRRFRLEPTASPGDPSEGECTSTPAESSSGTRSRGGNFDFLAEPGKSLEEPLASLEELATGGRSTLTKRKIPNSKRRRGL